MSGQRVILFMGLGAAVIAVVVAIAATCLDRPALKEDVQATATAQAATQSTPQTVAPTATPPPPTPSPAPAFRSFAAEIDAALKSDNLSFFRDHAVTQPVVCKPTDVPPQLGGPSCDFVGQEFPGFAYGRWRSEGSLLPLDALRQLERLWAEYVPGSSDQYGDGVPRIFATATNSDGSSAAIMTAMIRRLPDFGPGGPLRVVFVGHWRIEGGQWRMPYLLSAFVLGEDFLTTPGPDLAGRISNWERF